MRIIIALIIGFMVPITLAAQENAPGDKYAEMLGSIKSQFGIAEESEPLEYDRLVPLMEKLSQLIAELKADISVNSDPRYETLAKAEKLLAAMKEKRVTGKPGWEFVVNAGFSLTGGNSDLMNLHGGLMLGKNLLWINDISMKVTFDYRLDKNEITYRKWLVFLRYGHSITRSFYFFAQGNYGSDYASAIDNGIKLYGGLGYWFFDRPAPKLQFGFELGGGWYKVFFRNAVDESHFILNSRLWLLWNFADGVLFRQDIDFNPKMDDFKAFRFTVESRTEFEIFISKHLSLSLGLSIDYNSHPQPGIKNTDYSQATKLVFRL